MSSDKVKELQDKWQARVQSDVIEIRSISVQYEQGKHPFTIGAQHVAHASDNHCGRLGQETLEAIPCAASGCREAYSHPVHQSVTVCFLSMKRECTQKEVCEALNPIKDEMTKDGIDGFGFVNHKLITDWGKKPS